MGKISEGKYEIFTTKQDAIDKIRQMQGFCREEISDEKPIEFYCSKKGKIHIFHPSGRTVVNDSSIYLFGKVIEQDGKTYITFYTEFVKSGVVLKSVYLIIAIIFMVTGIILAISNAESHFTIAALFFAILFFAFQLFTVGKEKAFAPIDSEILINELEKRVEAINNWDK